MDPGRWAQVRALFDEVADLPADARPAALERRAAGDPALRAEVERLLAADADATAQARLAPAPMLLREVIGASGGDLAGHTVGRWRLLRELGAGGMGSVWLGQRIDVGFAQRAAVKLIRGRHAGAEARARFAAEQRILARLAHPHIAHLVDGGIGDDGQPFLAIEYVEGRSLTQHAERAGLAPDARVRLFLDVCAAVAHAHQQLIVHRDLKPSNILVSESGEVKLLDFGIAKLVGELEGEDAGLTATGVRLYTPGYAAPEQLRGEPVGTATDVYALGVVLYELLSGRLPFDVRSQSPADWERAVLTEEPTPPSREPATTRRGAGPETPAPGALTRLPRALRGDLDAIVLKALRREPQRRYASVTAFAADLEALLDGRPVSARRGTRRYRLSRFLRRHALATTLAGVALVAIVAGAGAAVWQARVAAAERDHARRQALAAERTTRFLTRVFQLADPGEARGATVSARDLLDRGARSVEFELADEPEVRSQMLVALGDAYGGLGLAQQSLALAERAWQDAQASADPLLQVRALSTLAAAQAAGGDPAASESTLRRALAIALPEDAPAQALRATLEVRLGSLLMSASRLAEAQTWFEAGLARQRRVLGDIEPDSAVPYSSWLHAHGRLREAETLLRETLERVRRERAPDDPIRVTLSAQYALNLSRQGRSAESVPLQREALEAKRLVYGDEHPSVDVSRHNLAKFLGEVGQWQEAEQVYVEMLPRLRSRDGARHPRTAAAEAALARVYLDTDRPAEALPLWDSALASARSHWGEIDGAVAIVRLGRGRTLLALGRAADAVQELDRAIASYTGLGDTGRGGRARALSERARAQLALGAHATALADARAGLAGLPEGNALARGYARAVLAQCLAASGDTPAARRELDAARALLADLQPADAPELRYARGLQ